ncbi:FHA domain-containing protein [Rhodoferax saidenbachensis]|uniref:FHA domain-containing protein n=1 Tax=Rhodoferax saidenbachensis TaxID=1484693 RepID=A0A1P8KEN6_9BURK|nr:FHA domain-containing protein [Rhodoferax saidenbachensis]APW44484.1 FHA domain-containing protein [Rhodoferax saidenbachensis]
MPKMIVSIDEVVIKEVQLTKDRTTLGRRPYNDIVIDNLAVSGEHAVLQMAGGEVVLEDLNSTNGTYVNGKAIKKQPLQNGDSIEIGKYKIKFVGDNAVADFDKTMVVKARPAAAPQAVAASPSGFPSGAGDSVGMGAFHAAIKVLSGAASGREVPLTKVVTTIGKPGVAVAAITKRQHGFVVHHVEGAGNPTLNGAPIGTDPISLKNGDLIELAGTQMQFVQT